MISQCPCSFFLIFFPAAKSSHPKKTGCTTKNTSTATPRASAPKDAGVAPQPEGTNARTSRKVEPQTSSTENPGQPGEFRASAPPPDASSSEAEGRCPAASPSGPQTECSTEVCREGEQTLSGVAPEPTDPSPHINAATEDTSFTEGHEDSSTQRDRQQGTGDGEEEEQSAVENGPRWMKFTPSRNEPAFSRLSYYLFPLSETNLIKCLQERKQIVR